MWPHGHACVFSKSPMKKYVHNSWSRLCPSNIILKICLEGTKWIEIQLWSVSHSAHSEGFHFCRIVLCNMTEICAIIYFTALCIYQLFFFDYPHNSKIITFFIWMIHFNYQHVRFICKFQNVLQWNKRQPNKLKCT